MVNCNQVAVPKDSKYTFKKMFFMIDAIVNQNCDVDQDLVSF